MKVVHSGSKDTGGWGKKKQSRFFRRRQRRLERREKRAPVRWVGVKIEREDWKYSRIEASRRAQRSRSARRFEPEKHFLRTYSHLHNRGLRVQSARNVVPPARLGPFGATAAHEHPILSPCEPAGGGSRRRVTAGFWRVRFPEWIFSI